MQTPRLMNQIKDARVIAADSGMAHAHQLGLQPELWVGDFDSASEALQSQYAGVPRLEFPAEKDATDGELAISQALARGASELVLVGGLGGRLDHTLAHAGFLLALTKREIDVILTSGKEEARALAYEVILENLGVGATLSIVPFSDLLGLTIEGVKWPLNHRKVPLGSALTVSNVVTHDVVTISLLAGQGLIIAQPVIA